MSSVLTHSPADVLAALLVLRGQGTDPADGDAWPVFATREPDEPDNCITVYDTLGRSFGYSQHTGENWEHPGFQVRVRAAVPKTSWTKANALAVFLNENPLALGVTVALDGESYCVESVACGGVIPLRRSDVPVSKRSIHVFSGTVTLRQLS